MAEDFHWAPWPELKDVRPEVSRFQLQDNPIPASLKQKLGPEGAMGKCALAQVAHCATSLCIAFVQLTLRL